MTGSNSSKASGIHENEIVKTKWYKIDTFMLPSKLSYLFLYGKEGIFKPYMALFLTNCGLNPAEAGLINGLCFIGYIIGSPFWGFLSDRYHKHRTIVLMLCVFSIIFMCSQPFVSIGSGNKGMNKCPEPTNKTSMISENTETEYASLLFWSMLGINTVGMFFDGAVLGIVDAGTIQRVSLNPRITTFGRQRLYGAIGFGCGALIGSMLVRIFPTVSVNCYSAIFFGYFVFVFALIVTSQWLLYGISFKSSRHMENSMNQKNKYILKSTLCKSRVIFFFLTVHVMGIEQGLYIYYTSVFLKELNAPVMLNGLCLAVGAFAGILTFEFSHRINKILGGPWKTMAICCFSYFIRFIVKSFVENPWFILIVQPLQGISSALFIATAVEYVRVISKPSIFTTMYGLMNACHFGFSMIIASVGGGQIYKVYGGRGLFRIAALLSAIWTLFIAISIYLDKPVEESGDINLEMEDLTKDVNDNVPSSA